MAVTIANECRAAALNGITALITNIRLDSAADAELAVLPLSWGSATTASPSVAVATVTPALTLSRFLVCVPKRVI